MVVLATKTVANQRIVKFADYDYERFPVELVRHLEPSEIQFYMYLWSMRTRNITKLVLFSMHVMEDTGMSYKTYNKAFHNLVKNGFLVIEESNTYIFCPDKYKVTDEEILKLIYEYIFKNYTENKRKKLNIGLFMRYEDELDIFPESSIVEGIDYLVNFGAENEDLPF